MLKTLQKTYAEKPVRFLLFPCNQFGSQEPDANSKIKAFAEGYVSLTQGNVLMFAKSNLNHVPCSYRGSDSCMPSSSMCCSQNDAIYDLLLAYPLKCSKCTQHVGPQTLGWNFNKILVDKEGKPWSHEIVPADDADLAHRIDRMLADDANGDAFMQVLTENTTVGMAAWCLISVFSTGMVVAFVLFRGKSSDELDSDYLRVA